jgi:mRNA interferase MazF
MVVRGEVWYARLDPTEGREIRKTRPCLVVSPPEIHDYLDIVTVVPLTSGSRPAGYRVPVRFKGKSGLILTEQIRTIDKSRLGRKLGRIDDPTLSQVLHILRESFSD